MKNYLKLIKRAKIGDTFKDLKIDGLNGLNRTESDSVFQELARMDNKQFYITFTDGTFLYEVVKPSKKFLNKEGQWNVTMSKKARKVLNEILK